VDGTCPYPAVRVEAPASRPGTTGLLKESPLVRSALVIDEEPRTAIGDGAEETPASEEDGCDHAYT